MILKEKEAKEKLLKGINENADVVKKTLGAKGKNVMLIDSMRLSNRITKDGVSISRAISIPDAIENAGSEIVKNSAEKTLSEAGDGTTTTTILTQSMCNSIVKEINLGKDSNQLCLDLKSDLSKVKEFIKSKSNKIENTDQIRQLAMVSSNSDIEIADILKEIYDNIGFEGSIDVRESDSLETNYEIVTGFTLPNTGYTTHLFVNNTAKNRVELYNSKVLVFNGKINNNYYLCK